MMSKKILWVVVGALVGFVAFYFWYNTDEKVLVRKTDRLIECFRKDSNDSVISGGMNSGAFRDLLAASVKVDFQYDDMDDLGGGVSYTAEDLVQKHLGFLKFVKSVEFFNESVKLLAVDGETAQMQVSLDVKMDPKVKKLGDSVDAELGFVKQDGEWKLNKVTIK